MEPPPFKQQLTRGIAKFIFEGIGTISYHMPGSAPQRQGIRRVSNLAYREKMPDDCGRNTKAHLYDIYIPPHNIKGAVCYVHGGGFSICSKETHHMMGKQFAKAGYITFLPNYRLAPDSIFPAAIFDVIHAISHIQSKLSHFGLRPENLIVSGESAGAHLALVSSLYAANPERLSPLSVPATLFPFKQLLLSCGMYVVDERGLFDRPATHPIVQERLSGIPPRYLPCPERLSVAERTLVSPHIWLKQLLTQPDVFQLPSIHINCGTQDPVLDDSRVIADILEQHHHPFQYSEYEGAPHAFMALTHLKAAKNAWREWLKVLED